jgi:hypothetical protein
MFPPFLPGLGMQPPNLKFNVRRRTFVVGSPLLYLPSKRQHSRPATDPIAATTPPIVYLFVSYIPPNISTPSLAQNQRVTVEVFLSRLDTMMKMTNNDRIGRRSVFCAIWMSLAGVVAVTIFSTMCHGFTLQSSIPIQSKQATFGAIARPMSSSTSETPTTTTSAFPNFNGVEVAKTGGKGVITASEKAAAQDLSLGAPRARPTGGHYLTKGGIQVTANVAGLEFSKSPTSQEGSEAVIERLIEKLDSHKGVLFTSSYEFPGRYARWSLGFVDPPLEVSGKADKCTIKALNNRGKVLLPAVEKAMQELKQQDILAEVKVFQDKETPSDGTAGSMAQIDVTVVPPPEVGTFSEEERSRQVRRK